MRKILLILVTALLLLSAISCEGSEQNDTTTEPDITGAPTELTVVLDYSLGSAEEDLTYASGSYYYDRAEEDWLLQKLYEESGFNFAADIFMNGDSVTVDWAADSDLFATQLGWDNGGIFLDVDDTRWFMMDSMWQTIKQNYDVGDDGVYYTMEGGMELTFDESFLISTFPADLPYAGSAFYFEHAGVRGGYEPSFTYQEDFELQSDPGDGLSAYEAAVEGYECLSWGNLWNEDDNLTITLIGLENIGVEECYVYMGQSESGSFKFAVNYYDYFVYLYDEPTGKYEMQVAG